MRTALTSIALGLVGVAALLLGLVVIRAPVLARIFLYPGTLLAPSVLHVIPAHWGAGDFGEDGRLLYVAAVNLSALAAWWSLFSTGVCVWLRRRAPSKVNA
jgi:hypothetical protein